MKERPRSKVWRPGVDKNAERKCRERPWQDVVLDLLGPSRMFARPNGLLQPMCLDKQFSGYWTPSTLRADNRPMQPGVRTNGRINK